MATYGQRLKSFYRTCKDGTLRFLKETFIVFSFLAFAVGLIYLVNLAETTSNANKVNYDLIDQFVKTCDSVKQGRINNNVGYYKIDSLAMEIKIDIKNNSGK